ncbi:MAG: TetR/AcrR family transcriptional regulator [Sphingobium sp.]
MIKIGPAFSDCEPTVERKTAASKIFDTARDLFYRRGIRAVGVDEIVCEAGVTKPSLYRAFKSKDDLVAACLRESAREGREMIEAVIDAAGCDPRDRLRAVVAYFAEKIGRPDFRGCPMSNVAVELPEPGHPGREVIEQCKTDMRGRMVGLARELRVDDPEALADGLLLVIEGAFATYHIFGSQGPSQFLRRTCDSLIDTHMKTEAWSPLSLR